MTTRAPQSFLGTGWAFPPEFGPGGAELATVSDVEDVHQSLAILFATRRGERAMQEGYGCNLDEHLFDEIDHGLVNRLITTITNAVLEHEPRINLEDVRVESDAREAGMLHIALEYVVRGTNTRYNMVFPFYLNEATNPGG